jgi:hypothetical protein
MPTASSSPRAACSRTIMIDGYIELKMEEIEKLRHDHAPGRVRHVLLGLSAAVAPALSRTERLVLMMDGQPVGAPQESASWFIEGALRGPHDLVVQRTTTRGKTIALSEPVRVYVLRPSIR